jgi:hypothetical protein
MCTVKDAPSVQTNHSPTSVAAVPDPTKIVKSAQEALHLQNLKEFYTNVSKRNQILLSVSSR